MILNSRPYRPARNVDSVSVLVYVVALQPNVPMTLVKSSEEMNELRERHLRLSRKRCKSLPTILAHDSLSGLSRR